MPSPWDLPVNRVVFTIAEDDVLAAYRLFARLRPLSILIRAGSIAFGAAEIAYLACATQVTFALAGLGGFIWYCASIALWWWWSLPRRVHRIYDQQASLKDELTVTWTDVDVETRTAHATGKAPWSRFRGRRENEHTILLFQSDALFQIMPKRVFSPEQATSLQACMASVPLRR